MRVGVRGSRAGCAPRWQRVLPTAAPPAWWPRRCTGSRRLDTRHAERAVTTIKVVCDWLLGGKEWIMKKLRVLAAVMVVALALLAIWVAGTGPQAGGPAANAGDTSASAYDYEAHDVVVQQMGPDGALQYELEAKQITQLPRNGRFRPAT